jgi:hypothetical protein
MATIPAPRAHGTSGSLAARLKGNPAYQAFWLLRTGFTVAPILFGLDKFSHLLVNWDRYLAPRVDDLLPGTAHQAMYAVGVIERRAVVGWRRSRALLRQLQDQYG